MIVRRLCHGTDHPPLGMAHLGLDFGPAERHLAALVPEKIQESEEIYLLGPGDEANVKVRDALMDIKILEHVDKNGLEQWRPVFKAPFPLDAAGIGQVCRAPGSAGARLDDRSGAR